MNEDFNDIHSNPQDHAADGGTPDSGAAQGSDGAAKESGGANDSAGSPGSVGGSGSGDGYNSGTNNSGSYNSGNYGSGTNNSGGYNSGTNNSGSYNSGNYGSGTNNSDGYNSGTNNSGGYGFGGSYNSGSYGSGNDGSGGGNDNSAYGGNAQYRWYYDDYQKALEQKAQAQKSAPEADEGKTEKRRKRRGLGPFLITVASVFGAAVLGLAVIGVTSIAGLSPHLGGGAAASSSSSPSVASESGSKSGSSSSPALNITSQPSSGSQVSASSGEMTVAQVASKLAPAVVGVVDYNLQSVEPTAEGSGIVMTEDGYIITNAHVISGAQEVQVVVPKGKTYTARVVGSDTKTDLAVLKIDTKGTKLQYASFGDSSQLQLGQNVIAIGNPGGLTLAGTVTNGIISGLNRQVGDTTSNMTYIQTNALINPGNSGGPLVNMYGQIVGINSSKIEETGYEGIGFAIPINTAKPIVDSLIRNGYVTGRVKIGISVYPLSTTYVQSRNYPSGLYVTAIDKTSDAYAKGLRARDIVTKIDGISIASDDSTAVYDKFYQEETKHKVGETVTLTVYRVDTGNTLTFSVKLMEDKGDDSSSADAQSSSDNSGSGSNGNGDNSGNNNGNGYDGNGSGSGNSYWGSFGQ